MPLISTKKAYPHCGEAPLHLQQLTIALIVSIALSGCGAATGPTAPTPPLNAAPKVYENTTRSGRVASEERWRGSITVTGDVFVDVGAMLTIEPGTTVRFAAGSDDQHNGPCEPDPNRLPDDPIMIYCELSSIDINGGTLRAVGTPTERITFTSTAAAPTRADWHTVHFRTGKLDLRYSLIEYAAQGVAISERPADVDITLTDNTIQHVATCGVCLGLDSLAPSVTIRVARNDISDCGHEGIDAGDVGQNWTLDVQQNTIHENANGVVIHSNFSRIRDNEFTRNRRAINIFDELGVFSAVRPPDLSGNTYVGNGIDILCEGFSCPYLLPQ